MTDKTSIIAGMDIQEDVLKLRIENNKLLDVINNQDVKIADLENKNKELTDQNTNLQIMLKAEREVRYNDDYLKGVCELEAKIEQLEEEKETLKHNKKTVAHLSSCISDVQEKKIADLEKQIEKMKDCYNCHYSDEYGRSQCASLIKCYECKHQSNWKLKE